MLLTFTKHVSGFLVRLNAMRAVRIRDHRTKCILFLGPIAAAHAFIREGRPGQWVRQQRKRHLREQVSYLYRSPRSAKLNACVPATTKWSSTLTSTSASASESVRVRA